MSRPGRRAAWTTLVTLAWVSVGGCLRVAGDDCEAWASDASDCDLPLRVYASPYAAVDWDQDRRLIAQFHDHVQTRTDYLDPYDAAGYHLMSLFHYTGMPDDPAFWTEPRWPAEAWLPSDYFGKLQSIEQFYPGGELVADWHITGLFLTEYVEYWDPSVDPVEQPHQYQTNQELIDRVHERGGYPVLAHPWTAAVTFEDLVGLHGVEVYSAFGQMNLATGLTDYDPNELMQEVWDDQLARDPRVLGLAVNDWHGPFCTNEDCVAHPEVKDSGKVELLARSSDYADVEDAFGRGAMFAVQDLGEAKLDYPRITHIAVDTDSITITYGAGELIWISHGREVGRGPRFDLDRLRGHARYVRAELRSVDGSIVFVQPFWLAPIGDIDGDGQVDGADLGLCEAVVAGTESDPPRSAARELWGVATVGRSGTARHTTTRARANKR